MYLGSKFFGYKFLKDILLITLLFIFCFYVSIAFITIKESIILNLKNIYHSALLGPATYILEQGLPRTSGVARALFFLFMIHLSLLCFKKNYFYINLFFCLLYSWTISVFDSRIVTIFYFISLLIIFYSNLFFFKKFSIFLILILIFINSQNIYVYLFSKQNINLQKRYSILISNVYNHYFNKEDKNYKNLSSNIENENHNIENENHNIENENHIDIIYFQKSFECNQEHLINKISSGRLCIWIYNLNTALKNYSVFIFGHGAQADRYNVNYISLPQEQSASNTLIYALTSGGILSVISFLVIYFIFFMNFLRYFLFGKNNLVNKSSILISCLLINSFILFRGITESSFAVFSLDYILFLVTTFIIFSNKVLSNHKKK